MLLRGAGQEAGHVDKGQNRDFEGIAKTHEARCFLRRVNIEHARKHHWLVRDHPNCASFNAAKTADDIRRMRWLNLKEVAFVQHLTNDFVHIIGLVGIVGNQRVERRLFAIERIAGWPLWHFLAV